MNKISLCPGCNKLQSRWDIFEPMPGFVNQCKYCGTNYKGKKFLLYVGAIVGLIIGVLGILADKEIISWELSLGLIGAIMIVALFSSQYYTKPIDVSDVKSDIVKRWLTPFLWWQSFCLVIFLVLVSGSIFFHDFKTTYEDTQCCLASVAEKIESPDKLRELIDSMNDSLKLQRLVSSIYMEFNFTVSGVFSLLFLFNFLFYFKIRSIQNNRLKFEISKK